MFSMAFVNMILEHGGVHKKLVIYPLLLTPDHYKALALPFYPRVIYARYIIFIFIIFMKFNENMKYDRKIIKIHR